MDTNKEKVMHSYINNELSEEELKLFRNSDDYAMLVFFDENIKKYKAPNFDAEAGFDKLNLNAKKSFKINKYYSHFAIAASFLLFFSIGLAYFFNFSNEVIKVSENHLTSFYLPDSSLVFLNNRSEVAFNSKKWKEERLLTLKGEAYFEVKKGSKFTVKTILGTVTVLGTRFNVKQRGNQFSVFCYRGRVKVNTNNENHILIKNQSYTTILTGKITTELQNKITKPEWIDRKLYFENSAMSAVISELQLYYDNKIILTPEVQNKRFTGYIYLDNSLEQNIQMFCSTFSLEYKKNAETLELSVHEK